MRLSIITDLHDLAEIQKILEKKFQTKYLPNCGAKEFLSSCADTEIIFTNPNNARFPLDRSILSKLKNLKVIATASTGTVHIDKIYCTKNGIKIISITKEYEILEQISSTAEHAVLLTLTLLRMTHISVQSVWDGHWDYKNFIGRQVNQLSVGIVGLGRLGKMYAKMMQTMGAKVQYFDPLKSNSEFKRTESLLELSKVVDILAVHCHVTPETINCVNDKILNSKKLKYLINTARGEIVDEDAVLRKLTNTNDFYYATDVIKDEQLEYQRNQFINKLREFKTKVVITPHQGGMTFDARKIAYTRTCSMLVDYFKDV